MHGVSSMCTLIVFFRQNYFRLKSNVKFQLKKVLCMGVAIGNTGLTHEELRQNSMMAINFLVSLLKKNWNNVKSLNVKSTMGKVYRVYG